MLKYNITDGGRPDMLKGEYRDCTVRALAIALDKPYEVVWFDLLLNGRKTRKGMWGFDSYVREKLQLPIKYYKPRLTLKNWIALHPLGIYIIHKRGHVIAVKNGIIHDSFQDSPNVFVDYAVEVKSSI